MYENTDSISRALRTSVSCFLIVPDNRGDNYIYREFFRNCNIYRWIALKPLQKVEWNALNHVQIIFIVGIRKKELFLFGTLSDLETLTGERGLRITFLNRLQLKTVMRSIFLVVCCASPESFLFGPIFGHPETLTEDLGVCKSHFWMRAMENVAMCKMV
jgi:hypothetical protein